MQKHIPCSGAPHCSNSADPTRVRVWRTPTMPAPAFWYYCDAHADVHARHVAEDAGPQIPPGSDGIRAVDPATPGALICGSCGRAWLEDITPAGRCPWEGDHAEPEEDDTPEDEAVFTIYRSECERVAGRPITDEEVTRIADALGHSSLTDTLDMIVGDICDGAGSQDDPA